MSNEIFDKDKENELIGKQKKYLNKKISILSGIIVLAVVICVIIISVLVPIYSMYQNVGSM